MRTIDKLVFLFMVMALTYLLVEIVPYSLVDMAGSFFKMFRLLINIVRSRYFIVN